MALTVRTRKLLGTGILIAWIFFYIGLAAYVGAAILPRSIFAELPFYAVAGIAWAFPARYLLVWMNRPDRASDGAPRSGGTMTESEDQ